MEVDQKNEIAVVGMSCRFPGSNDPNEFWDLISNGQNTFKLIPQSRQDKFDFTSLKTKQGSFLENPYDFDNDYFKISDVEATAMDPQQRIMLELALEAKENALIKNFEDRNVGVFIGANQRSYTDGMISKSYRKQFIEKVKELDTFNNIATDLKEQLLNEISALTDTKIYNDTTLTGNISNIIAGRISHVFNLKGPSLTIDTACSSSLVAIHMACESLRNNECNLAYAGGINLNLTPTIFSMMEKTGAISSSGTCVPFSEYSDGILLGEGGALVLLKRLDHAIRDGDNIMSVIKGSGVNNDGRSLGIMAPSWKGQLALLESVYTKYNFDRNKIGLMEAHGTSTRIGDAIEMTVMQRFFQHKKTPLSISSVKSNIGHTMAASGIASLIKVIMAIRSKKIPPTLFGQNVNPKWKLEEHQFYVEDHLKDWTSAELRSAGISSFGFGGTNAHLIIEEPDATIIKRKHSLPKYTKLKRKKFEFELYPSKDLHKESVYSVVWEASDIQESESNFKPQLWLLFCDKNNLQYQEQIIKTQAPCITTLPGKQFVRIDDLAYTMDRANAKHLKWLMQEIRSNHSIGIVYAPLENHKKDPQKTLAEMLFIKQLFTAASELKSEIRFWCLTGYSYKIKDVENVSPHEHSISTLFSSALNENPQMRGGIIDLKSDRKDDLSLLPQLLTSQFTGPLVLRKGKSFHPVLKLTHNKLDKKKTGKLRDDGVYVIIGGSTGIGKEIAKHIKSKCKAHIIITGTRPESDLDQLLRTTDGDSIEYIQSSIVDKKQTIDLFNSVFKKHKKINGVFLSAGVNSIGPLKSISDKDYERVINTKLLGVHHIQEAIKNRRVEFVYMLSSASSLSSLWSYGMAAYSAANAYLNAIAENNTDKKTKWLSRSWGIWEEVGMSKNIDTSRFRSMQAFKKSQAIKALDYSLEFDNPHLAIIHPNDFKACTHHWSTKKYQKKKKHSINKDSESIQLLSTQNTGLAKNIRSLSIKPYIKSLIGAEMNMEINAIDENESFNNLGLDSISALDIVSKIESAYEVSLNPTLLFEFDTITRLSEHLLGLVGDQLNGNRLNENVPNSIQLKSDRVNGLTNSATRLLPTQLTFYSNQKFYPDLPCNCMVKVSFARTFDIETLQKAWEYTVKQFQSLNLSFHMTANGPSQVITESHVNKIEICKLSPHDGLTNHIKDIEDRMINKVYQFVDSYLYDLCFIEIDDSHSLFIFNAHHIITDAWSMNLVMNQLIKTYSKIESSDLDLLQISDTSFLDYVKHKINEKATERSSASSEFWKKELKEFTPFDLPVKNVLNCVASSQNGSHNEILSITISNQIENKARSENLTLFQLLLSGYFLTIKHYSDQSDIVINLASDNRDRSFPGINGIAGCIADSSPLRIKISSDDSLVSLGKKVKAKLIAVGKFNSLSSIDHTSLHNLRSEIGPKGITPFGMSYLNIDYFNNDSILGDATIEARSALPFTDLSLICLKQKGCLHISWNYSATSFSKEYVREINDTFLKFFKDETNILRSSKSLEYSAVELPKTTLFPNHSKLHEKVFAACDIYKNDIAISDNENSISYSTLKRKSIQVANTILGFKNDQEEAIGILEYPGVNASIGILGILASNCAYIPLDPDWPHRRIETIIAHSGIEVLVTSSIYFNSIIENEQILKNLKVIVFLDEIPIDNSTLKGTSFFECSLASQTLLKDPVKGQSKDSLAYIMYTSGTTGKPKGVAVKHSAIAIFLSWISEEFNISTKDKFIATSSLGFGGSLRQMFSTLLAGGEIHPIDRYDFKDPKSLLAYLEENEITIFNTVPSILQNICNYMEVLAVDEPSPNLSNLRLILVGGEVLHVKTIRSWRNFFGTSHQIFNLYGSTETIVNATFHKVSGEQSVPIGSTRKGSHVLLLNEHGKLCSTDEKGELYVGGPSLAAGYYRDEKITNQKFVTLDIACADGIYYRTGDLATKDLKGVYHYLGRNDNQIQLYGNRIEPSEIESIIVNLEGISNAAVISHKKDRSHYLVAFIEYSKEHKDVYTKSDIREIIGEKLPRYMIPQKVEFIDKIPLNHAGKIDRSQLRAEAKTRDESIRNEINDPSVHTQEIIKSIWQKHLKINSIELDSDFFMIGGDSITILQVLHDIRKEFQIVPKPVELFRLRTIDQLSKRIEILNANSEAPLRSTILKKQDYSLSTNETKFPLSLSQRGFLYLHKLDPSTSPNLVALFPIEGELSMTAFENAVNYIVSRHPILRTSFMTERSSASQTVAPDLITKIELVDISVKSDKEQQTSIEGVFEDYKKLKFDLQKPPLFKIKILKRTNSSFILVAAMHHIIGDAWSFKVLMNELLKSYDLKLIDTNALLPELKSTFFDFTLSESKATASSRTKELEGFWRNAFYDLPKIQTLSNLPNQENALPVTLKLTGRRANDLKKLCATKGISLFQLIFTCYSRALQKTLNVKSVLINAAISGRDAQIKDIENIIGCFARNIPVRIDTSNKDLLNDVKEVENAFLNSIDHQDILPNKLIKILLDNNGRIELLSQFIISFMDFSAIADHESPNIKFDLNEADLYFDAGSASSELMLSIRVTDELMINLSGKANLKTKNHVINFIQQELYGLTDNPNNLMDHEANENLQQIDSALIAYLPSMQRLAELLPSASKKLNVAEAIIDRLLPDAKPKLLEIERTPYGNAGVVFLPLLADELFKLEKEKLLDLVMEAVKVGMQHGAKYISLAGNLASQTNYGFSINRRLSSGKLNNRGLTITTGHSCTVVSVVKTVEKLLNTLDLDIPNLTIGVAGYGSIGQASLELVLEKIGTPRKIIIADLAHQLPYLDKKIKELKKRFRNTIEIIGVNGEVPKEFYQANIIIGASSNGQILDVDKFLPGTILADDSFPHIVDTRKAISRMKNDKDILIVGAGKIDLGKSNREFVNLPFANDMISRILNKLGNEGLPGCLAEAILMSNDRSLPNTIGLVSNSSALKYWDKLSELNIGAVDLHLQGYKIENSLINSLKNIHSLWES